jgi:hypothetical protein
MLRIGAFSATMALTLAGLSGCFESPAVGPAAIQRDGDSLKIVACAAIDADLVFVEERNLAANRPWTTVWRFEAMLPLSSGDMISTDPSVTAGCPGEVRKVPRLAAGDQVSVLLANNLAEPPQSISAVFQLGEDGLSESRWLHPDGTSTITPCP